MDGEHLERVVIEVFGGCNYACQMCPQGTPEGRGKDFTRAMPYSMFVDLLDEIAESYGHPQINLEGSGEATMVRNLDKFILAAKDRGFPVFMATNGSMLFGDYMHRVIESGIDYVRFSVIGYDQKTYQEWMNTDIFDLVLRNIEETKNYIANAKSKCHLSSYHLVITDPETDVQAYRSNIIDRFGITGYIWQQHNWAGEWNTSGRHGQKRSCGRPFAKELTIRAGGLNGHRGAVVPCCQTMGQPREAWSVLGHTDEQSIDEIWNGELYNKLREAHANRDFDSIDYCKDCDQLIDDPDVLVWTNDPEMTVTGAIGLKDFHFVEKD